MPECTITHEDFRRGLDHIHGKLLATGFRFSSVAGEPTVFVARLELPTAAPGAPISTITTGDSSLRFVQSEG